VCGERMMMAQCITCGTELHPERAKKYNYCMARECQEKNAKGLTMVAVGMNKAADELMILDERTQADLASGRYRDQRRGSFGTSAPAPAPPVPAASQTAPASPTAPASRAAAPGPQPSTRRARPRPARRPAAQAASSRPWTERQERLALLYNEQGLRPDEIADKLGVTRYLATQIVLAARNRARA
jgi:DNA-directed RNA polymerase subunit N (RpoN/RPB10)